MNVSKIAKPMASWRRQMTILWPLLAGQRWSLAALVALGIIASVAESVGVSLVIILIYTAISVDAGMLNQGLLGWIAVTANELVGESIPALAIAIAGTILLKSLCTGTYNVLTASLKHDVHNIVRCSLLRQYLEVSYSYISRLDYGYLTSNVFQEAWNVSEFFFKTARIIINLCMIAVFFCILAGLSPAVTTVVGAGGIVFMVLLYLLRRPFQTVGYRITQLYEQLSETIVTAVQALRTIRAFGAERDILDKFSRLSAEEARTSIRLAKLENFIKPASELGYLILLGLIIWVSHLVGNPSAVTITLVALLHRLQPYVREVESNLMALAGLEASLRIVGDLLDRSDKPYPKDGSRPFTRLQQGLTLQQVSVVYSDETRPVLDRITLTLEQGTTVAIIGASGAGKTTLINLLLRLIEPYSGHIEVDGINLQDYQHQSWLRRISVAGQDIELIEGTIFENLRLGRGAVDHEAARQALEIAGALEFVNSLPDGIHTLVGERGLRLSGGQRQRIGIARAMAAQPDILIMDEATNAVDDALEEVIYRNIRNAMPDLTMIIIAHRGAAIASADKVYGMEKGRIAEGYDDAHGDERYALAGSG